MSGREQRVEPLDRGHAPAVDRQLDPGESLTKVGHELAPPLLDPREPRDELDRGEHLVERVRLERHDDRPVVAAQAPGRFEHHRVRDRADAAQLLGQHEVWLELGHARLVQRVDAVAGVQRGADRRIDLPRPGHLRWEPIRGDPRDALDGVGWEVALVRHGHQPIRQPEGAHDLAGGGQQRHDSPSGSLQPAGAGQPGRRVRSFGHRHATHRQSGRQRSICGSPWMPSVCDSSPQW